MVLLGLAVAASAQSLRPASPDSVGLSAERLERLSDTLQAYVDKGEVAGSVTLVARRGRIAYFEAFGQRDREANAPMQTDAIFRIASQSKAIVSVAAMTLVEEGKLLLTDPVGKYLPELMETKVAVARDGGGYDVVKAARPITVRDLLTHTSGFGYGNGVGGDLWTAAGQTGYYFADKNETIRDSVRRIATLPAHAQPGTQWIYGYSTDILGALVEVVAGKPLDQVLRERIFEPLGMRDTEFYLSRGKEARLAAVYSQNAGKLERAPTPGRRRGSGPLRGGAAQEFLGRRRPAVDGHRLRALPANAAERRRARRPAHLEPQDRRAHDDESPRRCFVQRRARGSASASMSSKTWVSAARRDPSANSAGAAPITRRTGWTRARSSSSCI